MGTWRKAGVVEGGTLSYPERGSPQGRVVAPMLAHSLVHAVLDPWVERGGRPRMRGRCFLIRFADDVRHITGHQIPYVLLRYTIATLREKRRAEVFL